MKTQRRTQRAMTLTNVAVGVGVALSLMGSAWADSTPTTAAVGGVVPVLIAPSNNNTHAVDFDGTYARADVMSTGDTVVLTYRHDDSDGDKDDSLTSVVWRYTSANGQEETITPTSNVPAVGGAPGTSTITIPSQALGAAAIRVEIWEQSETGIPRRGQQSIIVLDTSKGTNSGGGGGTPSLPGPIVMGSGAGDITGGIYRLADNPVAGSGAIDYSRTTGHQPVVSETYLFRAWRDTNGNGVWDAGEEDVTPHLSSMSWTLNGSNVTAAGSGAPTTLTNHATGVTTDQYTVPVNDASGSGAVSGDQGFGLAVVFN
ncbi:SinI family autotransporter-associated protein [Budvicia aquatica]|uniref:Intimin-like protein SinH n=1 Tax=Budvicia aquatica TaxID=82979 RepID=A0A2C6DMP4_9GAMM|nr:SinI family autotransporter-associated protein [Budvicia aquatica]PHI30054.1 ornithine carbamoyltransferase [Budvicia aquatica]VFS49031.1 intimin-like protein SinH [Budvicia aquatica]